MDFLISITFKWHIICLRHNIYVGCVAIERYIPEAVSCRNLCSLRWRLSERARAVSDKGQRRQGGEGRRVIRICNHDFGRDVTIPKLKITILPYQELLYNL